MAESKTVIIKLQIKAGQANPAPPVGPALGQHGINIQDFCIQFNEKTKEMNGDVVPVEIEVKEDRSFSFILKSPPASELLKKAAGIKKGADNPLINKVGTVNRKQLEEIAEKKKEDLNAYNIEKAVKIIAGTARSMGIKVKN